MLNPPSWLVGNWTTTDGDNPQDESVSVTSNNVVVSSGNLDFSWQINNLGLVVNEINSGNTYRLEYTINDMDFSYSFALQDDGSMAMTILDIVTFSYTKS